MSPRLPRIRRPFWSADDIAPQTGGGSWDNVHRKHRVRSELTFIGTGNGRGPHGEPARHVLHVTRRDFVFAEKVEVISKCCGPCLGYCGVGKRLREVKDIKDENETLIFDFEVETGGPYKQGALTVNEEVHVEVRYRELRDPQWEWETEFNLTLEVHRPGTPPAAPTTSAP
jgi:hypothetical protein